MKQTEVIKQLPEKGAAEFTMYLTQINAINFHYIQHNVPNHYSTRSWSKTKNKNWSKLQIQKASLVVFIQHHYHQLNNKMKPTIPETSFTFSDRHLKMKCYLNEHTCTSNVHITNIKIIHTQTYHNLNGVI